MWYCSENETALLIGLMRRDLVLLKEISRLMKDHGLSRTELRQTLETVNGDFKRLRHLLEASL